jgi:microcystin-dependent protein
MAARQYSSTVEAKTLSATINSSVTSMTLNSVTTLPVAYPYTLVIDPDKATEEIVTVTASGGGNNLTIARGQDGTSAQGHDAAAVVRHMITARDLQEPQDHIAASSNIHGLATAGPAGASGGVVVGTTASQVLTNKTLTSPTVNTPNITSPTISGTITGAVVTSANIVDGTIVNADINASAAIVATKLTGTITEFNTALTGNDFATLAGTETLTNKTLTSPVITGGTVNGGAALTVDSTELNYVDGVTSAIQTQLTTNTPVATIVMYGAAAAPTGWLLCDGTAVSRTTYAALFAVIGTEYGTGDGSTTFTLPDLKGRAPVGYGAGSGLTNRNDLGAKFGTETQTLTEANLPSHDHTIGWQSDGTNDHDHALDSGTVTRVAGPSDGGSSGTGTINSGLAGSGTAHNNLQPSTVVNFIIKH